MKKILLLLLAVLTLAACKQERAQAYSRDREKEKKLIAHFVKEQGYKFITELPEKGVAWGEKEDYEIPNYDQMYIHITQVGDTSMEPIAARERVIVRYRKYSLQDLDNPVESQWSSLEAGYPIQFNYLETNQLACEAWHYAISVMQYPESECRMMCPSKWGFNADIQSVTPYIYDLSVKVKR